ncbi:MAG TPA: serine/threonine-protein kinase, partial [Polyangiaceae bacterium]|nr:serine/threonine-protein kinase [Polyangiaceae bacterium]
MPGPSASDAPTAADGGKGSDPFELCGVTIADKYRVVSLVGTGGFGVVYRAVHTGFGEPVAVKCIKLPGELGAREREELLTRLQDEGRVLHRLSKQSSGIVQALDVGAVTSPNGQWLPYLVMEWLEGETLAGYMRARLSRGEGALSIAQAIELLEPAARALEVAHKQKVAHRDVKPENLYLVEVAGQRTIKVLDFGIAKVLAQHATFTAAPAATQKAASAFTPSYGAPEQFNKKRGATGPWTDVFALALILVEAVSGERALDGDDATQLYIAAADPAARPTLRHKGVQASEAVEDVLSRALAVEP